MKKTKTIGRVAYASILNNKVNKIKIRNKASLLPKRQ